MSFPPHRRDDSSHSSHFSFFSDSETISESDLADSTTVSPSESQAWSRTPSLACSTNSSTATSTTPSKVQQERQPGARPPDRLMPQNPFDPSYGQDHLNLHSRAHPGPRTRPDYFRHHTTGAHGRPPYPARPTPSYPDLHDNPFYTPATYLPGTSPSPNYPPPQLPGYPPAPVSTQAAPAMAFWPQFGGQWGGQVPQPQFAPQQPFMVAQQPPAAAVAPAPAQSSTQDNRGFQDMLAELRQLQFEKGRHEEEEKIKRAVAAARLKQQEHDAEAKRLRQRVLQEAEQEEREKEEEYKRMLADHERKKKEAADKEKRLVEEYQLKMKAQEAEEKKKEKEIVDAYHRKQDAEKKKQKEEQKKLQEAMTVQLLKRGYTPDMIEDMLESDEQEARKHKKEEGRYTMVAREDVSIRILEQQGFEWRLDGGGDTDVLWIWDIHPRDLELIYHLTRLKKGRGGTTRKKIRAKKEKENDALELIRKARQKKQKKITFSFGP